MTITIDSTFPHYSNTDDNQFVEIEGSFKRFKEMVTPSDVLQFGLVGIPKVFPMTNEQITEEYVGFHLQAAISQLEMQGMILSPIITYMIEDFNDEGLGGTRFFPMLPKKYPLRKIEYIELRFPNGTRDPSTLVYRIPDAWISWEPNISKVNVIATTGVLAPTVVQGSANIPMFNLSLTSYRPSGIRMAYQAGFDQDKLPIVVWQLILDLTTYNMLSELGPLLFPTTGITVSMDSLSQSGQLPGPRIFEARLNSLLMRIEKNKQLIAGYYGKQITCEFAGI